MRLLFFILLLANVTFFAYGWFGPGAQAGGDTQIVSQQLNPEKIRLLQPEQVSALARKSEPAKHDTAKPETAKPMTACLEWGAFGNSDAARAEQALEPFALGAKLSQRRQEDIAGFWVYIGPLSSRQLAVQKAGELKRLGIDDYFVVSDEPKWRNSVSLGVFKTEEAAKARLAALRTKGVRSATIGARETRQGKTYFQMRDLDSGLTAKLNALKQGYPGTELRECAADEKKG
ncbi:MAG: SPOR domain-containing protein [Burkholderiales bacterium]|nr:SPOR domain-containing protein [Burkholderiales bacterium]